MDQTALERRLVALETALAHHEAEIRDLSDVIARQWQAIDALGRRADRAEALIRRLSTDETGDGKPPIPD